MEFDNSLEFLKLLIKKKSITPEDDGCQDLIESFLKPLGFNRRVMNFNNVKNSIYSITSSNFSSRYTLRYPFPDPISRIESFASFDKLFKYMALGSKSARTHG